MPTLIEIWRPIKNGAFRWSADGQLSPKQYMSRDQAERAAVKATGADPWIIEHRPVGERPRGMY